MTVNNATVIQKRLVLLGMLHVLDDLAGSRCCSSDTRAQLTWFVGFPVAKWFLKYVMPALEDEINNGMCAPTLITVWLGTNDVVLTGGSNAEMHVLIETYTENLVNIVTSFQAAAPDVKILLVPPPHVNDVARAKYAKQQADAKRSLVGRFNAMPGTYAHACVKAGLKTGVPVLNLYEYFSAMPEATRNVLLRDGLHFITADHKIVDKQFRSKIETEFPSVITKF
ncbi:hypothetical protein BBO99_00003002 [Phytophthora kernoviae]|uniref:SGNH hydrolase-type esterase domain-containing protein n=2 Tax=Phytophthora kernoviae TaxID=325452 RepID=A0A3R7H1V2_9STRA|nr:hypothetical protein G195_003463 [Phytophthora kernoviae 00238/432]KAG2528614.1 hypothetical protein JM16_002675 [Phytophthora kernoviae]KAG2529041.1 hypothetical protein JM18_002548 [Phytophthora kernoviae]RLN10114.1 hypothetical protein BBI17_003066 [Phytophthora kernoviae]RLN82315.1 hypothetical protein BBO99_00003002 [Phytophthora kernoviae]